jgi:hypothetical protein
MDKNVVTAAIVALIVSVIYNKISAAYIFNVIDGHVNNMIEMVKKLIRDTYSDKGSSKRS